MSTIDYLYPATLLDVEQYCLLRYILKSEDPAACHLVPHLTGSHHKNKTTHNVGSSNHPLDAILFVRIQAQLPSNANNIDSDRVDEVDDEYGSDLDHDDNDDSGYDLYIMVK